MAAETPLNPNLPARVAYQGIPGAYAHQAAIQFFTDQLITLHCYPNFLDIVQAVENNQADYAVLPIENALAGFVLPCCDLLIQTSLYIQAEIYVDIVHCLLTRPKTSLSDLKAVLSHPQALTQCSTYLSSQSLIAQAHSNTAVAAQYVSQKDDRSIAAIASEYAAKEYGLKILARDIANQPNNQTRFLILARQSKPENLSSKSCKTMLKLSFDNTNHTPQALLTLLLNNNVNITHIQTRPDPIIPWQYDCLIELKGQIAHLKKLINTNKACKNKIRHLGQYTNKQ